MGWLARVVVSSAASTVIGCAAIANLGDAQTADDPNDAGGTQSSGGTTIDAGTRPDGGGTSGDGSSTTGEAGSVDGAPACTKTPTGGACTAATMCCSNACTTDRKCNDQCRTTGGCNPFSNSECCLGTYCSPNSGPQCATCRANGTNAEIAPIINTILPQSCCSNHVDGTGKCAP